MSPCYIHLEVTDDESLPFLVEVSQQLVEAVRLEREGEDVRDRVRSHASGLRRVDTRYSTSLGEHN